MCCGELEWYPDGISGSDINIYARVLAVADTFDAVTSDRPYRTGAPPGAAIETEAREHAGAVGFQQDVGVLDQCGKGLAPGI